MEGLDNSLVPSGYHIQSSLCIPIWNVNQEVIGVAQAVNKGGERDAQAFDHLDMRMSRTYLAFCGICLMNARLYNRSRLESKRSKVLLEMAKCVFEEQSTVEVLVKRIMKELLTFLCCQRCSVAVFDSSVDMTSLVGTTADSQLSADFASHLFVRRSFIIDVTNFLCSLTEQCFRFTAETVKSIPFGAIRFGRIGRNFGLWSGE